MEWAWWADEGVGLGGLVCVAGSDFCLGLVWFIIESRVRLVICITRTHGVI